MRSGISLQDSLLNTSKGKGALPLTPVTAALLYLGVALVFTWPLAAGLTRDIPWDLGDSLLNAWILAWDADRMLRVLGGDLGALRNFWNANIFYPEPLTLAYSEHLFAQAVQILPVYALTGNIILSYNLLFLSTFVLSGLGMFLFVREVTGSAPAGFAAGLIYAFAPYRVPQFSHLQVISSQWMPFALYGLRRYFTTRHTKALVWAAAALVAQNLSNGYFLLFFAPFVLAYALFEIATRKLWTDAHVWAALSVDRDHRYGVDAAVSPSLSRVATTRLWSACAHRGEILFGRRLQLLDGSGRVSLMGRADSRLSESGRRSLSDDQRALPGLSWRRA